MKIQGGTAPLLPVADVHATCLQPVYTPLKGLLLSVLQRHYKQAFRIFIQPH